MHAGVLLKSMPLSIHADFNVIVYASDYICDTQDCMGTAGEDLQRSDVSPVSIKYELQGLIIIMLAPFCFIIRIMFELQFLYLRIVGV